MTTATILVCDDETDLREMLEEYLCKRGFSVILAGNADQMRAALETSVPDVICSLAR